MVMFEVTLHGKFYDEVFYEGTMSEAEVKFDLVECDGYPSDIQVTRVVCELEE